MALLRKPLPAIGLKGKAGSGKSTAARYLARHGYDQVLGFAAPIRSMLRGLGLHESELNNGLKEKPCDKLNGLTPRAMMQMIGGGARQLDHDFWIAIWRRRAVELIEDGWQVIADDLRYENEAKVIRALGGAVIEIHNVNAPSEIGGIAGHESESQDFDPDIIVINDGRILSDFHTALDEAMSVLLESVVDERIAA